MSEDNCPTEPDKEQPSGSSVLGKVYEETTKQLPELNSKKLNYSIHDYSSYSNSYIPGNILEDKPGEQSSRWSSDTNNPHQFITLKLERPAIVTGISFGKFQKTHVCNLKKFKVFGGLDDVTFVEVLESGLRNDNTPESFNVKHKLKNHHFPSSYIKIQPLQSWGPSFNFSVWYVELSGDDSPSKVQQSIKWQKEVRELETIRLCLKHFREQNYLEAFESLEKKTRVQLEDPLLTVLHTDLVKDGDYERVESKMVECLQEGMFSGFISRQQPKPIWTPLIYPDDTNLEDIIGPISGPSLPLSPDSESLNSNDDNSAVVAIHSEPPRRGGHQLVMDSTSQTIYLFGGWDGKKDLADLWSYHIPSNRWTMLFQNTEAEGGPPPRSCHKMVLDPTYRQLFVLGRYVERTLRDSLSAIKSDFYLYDITSNKWTQITDDTGAMGGPNLIFDHQMCLDNEKRKIYVFGGQSLHSNINGDERPDKRFSGLYVYHISTNTWKCIWEDGQTISKGPPVKSRTGHSMLFNTADRCLYIFGGQRKRAGRDEYINDFLTFDVDSETVNFLSDGIKNSYSSLPAVGYTQRATIDCKRGEIHVMTGLNLDKEKKVGESRVSNSFWVYEIKQGRWSCIYKNEKNNPAYWNSRQSIEPRPRHAHQLVYDEEQEVHYLYGGNPGGKEGKEGKVRLGDFWRLRLVRPAVCDLERSCRLRIRTGKFQELCTVSPMDALNYLHTRLSPCVDHTSSEEEKQFQLLPSQVFHQIEERGAVYKIRTDLFNSLVDFFPDSMTQPSGNLLDLVPIESLGKKELPNLQCRL